jgi:hypothetical protein
VHQKGNNNENDRMVKCTSVVVTKEQGVYPQDKRGVDVDVGHFEKGHQKKEKEKKISKDASSIQFKQRPTRYARGK